MDYEIDVYIQRFPILIWNDSVIVVLHQLLEDLGGIQSGHLSMDNSVLVVQDA